MKRYSAWTVPPIPAPVSYTHLEVYKRQGLPQPAGLVLMAPWADLTCGGDSYEFNFENDPLFGNSRESMLYNSAYIGQADPREPYMSLSTFLCWLANRYF